jgi:beta-lactam-binding protein with PASTA domain
MPLLCRLALVLFALSTADKAFSQSTAGAVNKQTYRLTPHVQGRRIAVATQLLRLAKLQFAEGVFYIAPQHWRDDLKLGVIYMQIPVPKTPIIDGGPVACWHFARPQSDQRIILMPDLTGLTPADVRLHLAKHKLSAMKTATPDVADGIKVTDQYPRPKQKVYEKTSVYLRFGQQD